MFTFIEFWLGGVIPGLFGLWCYWRFLGSVKELTLANALGRSLWAFVPVINWALGGTVILAVLGLVILTIFSYLPNPRDFQEEIMTTITPLTNQQAFDLAVNGIRKQNYQRSLVISSMGARSASCAYRGPDGLKCAVGHMIPDCIEIPEDCNAVGFTTLLSKVLEVNLLLSPVTDTLLVELQQTHDYMTTSDLEDDLGNIDLQTPDAVEARFKSIAASYELVYTPPETKE